MENTEPTLMAADLNQQGIVLLKAGNIETAKEKYNKAIELDPMFMDTYKNYGDLFLRTGEYQEAKNYYKKALLIEKAGVVYFQYGNACFMNDEPHEGLEYYNLALSSGFDSDEMFFFMGMAYEYMNDNRMALRYIQKAIIKNPSRPDYKVKKVSVLLSLNMIEEAKESIEEILLNEPELFDGYHMKTSILLEEKNYEEAVAFSKMAAEKFPEDVELMYDYAKSTALSGKGEEALKIIERTKKLNYFEEAKARFTLLEAEINAENGNMEEAIKKCEECISLEKEDEIYEEARFMRINLALTVPDFECALNHSVQLVEKGEHNSYYYAALYFRAFCAGKTGQAEESNKFYQEAISLYRMSTLQNPEAFDAYLYRAMCYRDTEQYDEALELLEFMENLSDEIAEIYTIRADVYKKTSRESLAKEELEKAFRIKPELREAFHEGGE